MFACIHAEQKYMYIRLRQCTYVFTCIYTWKNVTSSRNTSHTKPPHTLILYFARSRARALSSTTLALAFALALIVYLKAVSLLWRSSSWSVLDAPVDEIRAYFGEEIAFYFAWVGFYSKATLVPGIVGAVLWVSSNYIFQVDIDHNAYAPLYGIGVAVWSRCVATFYNALQCVAVCCRVLQCVQCDAERRRVMPCDAVCCSVCSVVLSCVAVCCSVLPCVAVRCSMLQYDAVCYSMLPCAMTCCSVLQCVASTGV